MIMEQKQQLKAVETWQVSINWYGKHRLSPEYTTKEDALAAASKFLAKFEGRYLQVTFVRNVRYVTAG